MAVGELIQGKVHPVKGVRLAAVAGGIRYSNRLDLVLVELNEQASCAGVFTQNRFCAPPVVLSREHLKCSSTRYFLINTGNANAGTGAAGRQAAVRCCEGVAELAGVPYQCVLPFSTGVIGESLPFNKILQALPVAFRALSDDSWAAAAKGIMTTDTRPKLVSEQVHINGIKISITGIAKGAGMLKPNMATMLGFIFTDAKIAQAFLESLLATAVNQSFNRLTVDGDTSTNDSCMLVATGCSGVVIDDIDSSDAIEFVNALNRVFRTLATELIRDAEGASKFITVRVEHGASEEECLRVAYTIAESPLVKTAFFASDPNWGRILAAVGRAGINDLDIDAVAIFLGKTQIVGGGCRHMDYTEAMGQAEMSQEEITVTVQLARGHCTESVWTSDLSNDYVRINAEYRT